MERDISLTQDLAERFSTLELLTRLLDLELAWISIDSVATLHRCCMNVSREKEKREKERFRPCRECVKRFARAYARESLDFHIKAAGLFAGAACKVRFRGSGIPRAATGRGGRLLSRCERATSRPGTALRFVSGESRLQCWSRGREEARDHVQFHEPRMYSRKRLVSPLARAALLCKRPARFWSSIEHASGRARPLVTADESPIIPANAGNFPRRFVIPSDSLSRPIDRRRIGSVLRHARSRIVTKVNSVSATNKRQRFVAKCDRYGSLHTACVSRLALRCFRFKSRLHVSFR